MNGDVPEVTPWSRRRWVAVVLIALVLQLAVLHLLSPAVSAPERPAGAGLTVRWLANPALAKRTLDLLLLDDPTLLAMASSRGFSGAGWLRPPPQEFRVSEWTDAERSLAQPTQSLGGAFRLVAPAASQPVFEPARKPVIAARGAEAAPPVIRAASRLLVQGDIHRRALLRAPGLPSYAHTDVLADTRVHVLVSDEGLVFSPRLAGATVARNPVQREADLHALDVARALRFAPLPKAGSQGPGSLVEGLLIFQWHTVEPPAPAKE